MRLTDYIQPKRQFYVIRREESSTIGSRQRRNRRRPEVSRPKRLPVRNSRASEPVGAPYHRTAHREVVSLEQGLELASSHPAGHGQRGNILRCLALGGV